MGGDGRLYILTVVVTHGHACVKTRRPVYHNRYQKLILFILCKYEKHSSLMVLIPGYSILVSEAEARVISHSVVCSSTAENTKVPPPGSHRCCQFSLVISMDRVSTGGNVECQAAWGGAASTTDAEGTVPVLGTFIIQWKRQISKTVNSSSIWKATHFHAHVLQVRKWGLSEVS